METENRTRRKIPRVLGIVVLSAALLSCAFHPEVNSEEYDLPNLAVLNILQGIHSDNYGVKMSCIYFAGKYKIHDTSKDLLQVMKETKDEDICQMVVWSLYQIGDDSCCNQVRTIVEDFPSEKVKGLCDYLHKIREYENEIASARP